MNSRNFTHFDLEFLKSPSIEYGIKISKALLKYFADSEEKDVLVEVNPILEASPTIIHCKSFEQLVSYLRKSHKEAFLYRGQHTRYLTTFSGTIEGMQTWLSGGEVAGDVFLQVKTESLLPTIYRNPQISIQPPGIHHALLAIRLINESNIEVWRNVLKAYFDEILRFDEISLLRFMAQSSAIPDIASSNEIDTGEVFIQRNLMRLISLSQHYEINSAMVDFSKVIDVAMWFSKYTWEEIKVDHGQGVMYRVDSNKFKKAIKNIFPIGTWQSRIRLLKSYIGYVDISDFETSLALRPLKQHGVGFMGLENATAYLILLFSGALEVFTFNHSPTDFDLIGLSKSDICPADDPALSIFNMSSKVQSGAFSMLELDTLLRNCGYQKKNIDRVKLLYINRHL